MKVLWHSNAPWSPTGYGNQTGLFGPEIAKHHELTYSAFYGLEGDALNWKGRPVLPALGNEYGNMYLPRHAQRAFGGKARDGVVISLMDVWVLEVPMARQLNMACITPVDHEPAPPAVVDFLMKTGVVPIAMSRFGEAMLNGMDPLYVPHCVDTDVMKPMSGAREEAGAPEDAFIVGIVAANKGAPSRKSFHEMLQAFRIFIESHDDALLYLHTVRDGSLSRGEDINAMIRALGIPAGRIFGPDSYRLMLHPYSQQEMALSFNSLDVLMNCAQGEGFGIPVLEAAACGVPSIVTNFSAMPEVAGDAGWHVGCRKRWTGQDSWQMTPEVEDIVAALEQAYAEGEAARRARSELVRKHALTYSVPEVMANYMLPALAEVERRFADREPVALKVAA